MDNPYTSESTNDKDLSSGNSVNSPNDESFAINNTNGRPLHPPSSRTASQSTTTTTKIPQQLPSREQIQIMKLREANNKYKSLLKMAKERIQAQEEELEKMQGKITKLEEKSLSTSSLNKIPTSSSTDPHGTNGFNNDETDSIVRICQRIRLEVSSSSDNKSPDSEPNKTEEEEEPPIWALVEYETNPDNVSTPYRRHQQWEKFSSESQLSDYIRRDSGEPLLLPPYSLTPQQSQDIQTNSQKTVDQITEEFRRFRVRSEVARKQADATVRAIHSNNVVTTRAKIHGQDLENELQQARTNHAQLASLQRELAEQDAHWKGAYDNLLSENTALKSSGAEALLAAQWRQRYEACQREKENFQTNFQMMQRQVESMSGDLKTKDAGKYERRYRDMKESFRLYRKKAKEIFEAQQAGNTEILGVNDRGMEDARMLYLRNLMVNYLSSDPAVRDHMEGAIGTVLKFSDDEMTRIESKREVERDAWFK